MQRSKECLCFVNTRLIKRFDIVITKYGKNDVSSKIKRVLGLPGETIWFTVGSEGTARTNSPLSPPLASQRNILEPIFSRRNFWLYSVVL